MKTMTGATESPKAAEAVGSIIPNRFLRKASRSIE